MSPDFPSGRLPRLRRVLLLPLVALLVLAPITSAGATESTPACGDLSKPEVEAAVLKLVAFAEQYRSGAVPPKAEDVEAQLTELFALVDYLIVQADQLSDEEAEEFLAEIEALLVAQGVPAEEVDAAVAALEDLLDKEETPTPEEAFEAIFQAVAPYLYKLGFTEEQVAALYAYLLAFLPEHKPCPSETPKPTETPTPKPTDTATPAPTPTATTVPVTNPTPTPTPTPTATATKSASPAPTSTETSTAGSGLADTGIDDPVLLLGVVAVAMIAGGLALEAGQRRPARRREAARRR